MEFRKGSNGVVINNNKSGLMEARRRKRASKVKDDKIKELEERIEYLESFLPQIKDIVDDKY